MNSTIIKAGVIGWPIDHSLSPRLHGYWLRNYSINGTYRAIAVEGETLSATLQHLVQEGYVGLNVTVPHKQTIMGCLDVLSEQARKIGAVNTIVMDEHGKLHGSNTDGFGFIENLKQGCPGFKASKGPAVVLGAGGAARAIVVALIEEGASSVTLINRTRQRAEDLADNLMDPVRTVDWDNRDAALEGAGLLVNTTTLGMVGKPQLEISLDNLPSDALVSDIVYAPLETRLLKAAKTRGNATVDGLGMLLHQARPGFAAWFGVEPTVTDDLRRHVLAGTGA
jgi:shikimate dehydrogenase